MTTEIGTKVNVTPQKVNSTKDDTAKAELLIEGFKELKPLVKPQDIGKAMFKCQCSAKTVERRLSGILGSLLVDTVMYSIIYNEVDKRQTLIAA